MAPAKRSTAKNKKSLFPVDGTPSEVLASEIVAKYGDLTPSVQMIMDSELTDEGRVTALTLFQQSLGVRGDPNRIPANAIAAGQLAHGSTAPAAAE